MAIKVVSEGPVQTRRHVCENCCFALEFCNVDLVAHRADNDGDPLEARGRYLVCPRTECRHRNLIDRAGQ